MQIIRASERKLVPWKNGLGIAAEVAVRPEGADFDRFHWRISMAQVVSGGSFSSFAGVERVLAVLEGRIVLDIEGHGRCDLSAGAVTITFPGDVPVQATVVDGPVTDLNIMTRGGRASVDHRSAPAQIVTTETSAILSMTDGLRLSCSGAISTLDRYDTAVLERMPGKAIDVSSTGPADFYLIDIGR